MPNIEIHIDFDSLTRQIGLAKCNRVRGTETIVFEYTAEWLADPNRFSIEPALALTRGIFVPQAKQ